MVNPSPLYSPLIVILECASQVVTGSNFRYFVLVYPLRMNLVYNGLPYLVAWFRYSFYGLYIDQYYRYIILPNRWVIIYQYHNHRYVSSHFTIYNGYPRWLIISGDSSSAWALFGCPRGRERTGDPMGRGEIMGCRTLDISIDNGLVNVYKKRTGKIHRAINGKID